jgi:hypothetical protein
LKTIIIVIEHGLSLGYFLYTDLYKQMLNGKVRLVMLVQDELLPKMRQDYASVPNLVFESLREQGHPLSPQPPFPHPRDHRIHRVRARITFLTYVDTNRNGRSMSRGRWFTLMQPSRTFISCVIPAWPIFLWLKKLFAPDLWGSA